MLVFCHLLSFASLQRKPVENTLSGMEERTFLAVIAQLTKRLSFFKGSLSPLSPLASQDESLIGDADAVPFQPKDPWNAPSKIAESAQSASNGNSSSVTADNSKYSKHNFLEAVAKYHRGNRDSQDSREHSSKDKKVRFVLSLSGLEERFSKKPVSLNRILFPVNCKPSLPPHCSSLS